MGQVELPERDPRLARPRRKIPGALCPTSWTTPSDVPTWRNSGRRCEELRDSHEYQAFLLGASEVVAQGGTYVETLERLAEVAVPMLADLCLVDTLTWEGRVERTAARHADPKSSLWSRSSGPTIRLTPPGIAPQYRGDENGPSPLVGNR